LAKSALVLASASPRRARILEELGVAFRVVVSGAEEDDREGEDAVARVVRLARSKAEVVARHEMLPVLGADTEVVVDGACLGKPATQADAVSMLTRLSGRIHEVLTGVCLAREGRVYSGVDRTQVRFARLSAAEIEWYVSTGEPMDKAGAYHVDGRGACFIESIDGSPSNVAGLPVRLLLQLLREAGIEGLLGLSVPLECGPPGRGERFEAR
jgi:septum formation protein